MGSRGGVAADDPSPSRAMVAHELLAAAPAADRAGAGPDRPAGGADVGPGGGTGRLDGLGPPGTVGPGLSYRKRVAARMPTGSSIPTISSGSASDSRDSHRIVL